jgi:hypothetical protein
VELIGFSWNPVDWAKGLISWFGGQISEAASGLLGDVFEWIAALLLRGIIWLFEVVLRFADEATSPELDAEWFTGGPLAVAKNIAAYLLFLFVILAIAEAVWNRDGGQLLRSTAQDVPRVMFLELMLIAGTMGAIAVGDYFSIQSLELFGANIRAVPESIEQSTDGLEFGAGVLVICLVGLFLLVAALFVAFELVIREGLILVLVPLVAVLLATEVYRPTKGMGGRAMRLLGVVIALKPMIALCLAIGAAALGNEAVEAHREQAHVAAEEPAPNPSGIASEWVVGRWAAEMRGLGIPDEYLIAENCVPAPQADPVFGQSCYPLETVDGQVRVVEPIDRAAVTRPDDDAEAIEGADTAAVAPTFGLMLAGMAVMVLAGMSPFVLMRLISLEAAAESQTWRHGVSGAARAGASKASNFATGGAGVPGGAAGALGRAAGRGKSAVPGGAAANKAGL